MTLTTLLGLGCARPTYPEAERELKDLLRPSEEALFGTLSPRPEAVVEQQRCSDPFIGPRRGLRPIVEFKAPISSLSTDPETFVRTAEDVWRHAGLEVRSDDAANLVSRSAMQDDYALHAYVNLTSSEATLSGTGPCVDDPES